MTKKHMAAIFIILCSVFVTIFAFGPKLLDQQLNLVVDHPPFNISTKAKQLHNSLFIGDWHADSTLWQRDLSKAHDYGHVDIPRLQQGNVALQMFTTVTKSPSGLNYEHNEAQTSDDITRLALLQRWPKATWDSLTARALMQADKLHEIARVDSQNFMLITSQQTLAGFLQKRENNATLVGGLIGTEGSHALDGDLANIQRLFEYGFRMMSLQHFFDNKLGGSLHGISQKGLSVFGQQAVAKMMELDIIIDLSHSSEQVVKDAVNIVQGPMVISHTGFQGHCQSKRNIPDTLMQSIADNGGLIAVGYWEGAVCGTSPKKIAEAIVYGVELLGENHVALGSDFDGTVATQFDTSELAVITHALLEAGLNEQQVAKVMGGNMLEFLKKNLPNIPGS